MIFIDLAGQEKNSDKDSQFININYSYITCLLQDLKKGLSINKNTIIEKCLAQYFKLSNHLIIILTIANNLNSIDLIKQFPFKEVSYEKESMASISQNDNTIQSSYLEDSIDNLNQDVSRFEDQDSNWSIDHLNQDVSKSRREIEDQASNGLAKKKNPIKIASSLISITLTLLACYTI